MRRTYVEAGIRATSKIVLAGILTMPATVIAKAQERIPGILRELLPSIGSAPPPVPLDEARSSSARCNGTEWQALIDPLIAADPQADADNRAAAGDFTIKTGVSLIGATSAPQLIAGPVRSDGSALDRVAGQPIFGLPVGVGLLAPGVILSNDGVRLVVRLPSIAVMQMSAQRQNADQDALWCRLASQSLATDYAVRFNKRLVVHPDFPEKDVAFPEPEHSVQPKPTLPQINDKPAHGLAPAKIPNIAVAARFGQLDRVREFVVASADLAATDRLGASAISWSVIRDYPEIFELLIKQDGGQNFCSALAYAVRYARNDMALALVRRCTDGPSRAELLPMALRGQRKDLARALLETPPLLAFAEPAPDLPYQSNVPGRQSLAIALEQKDFDFARLLLKHGVSAEAAAQNSFGSFGTPLGQAIIRRQTDIVEFLLDNGLDATSWAWTTSDRKAGASAVHLAIENRAHDILRLLVARGVSISRGRIDPAGTPSAIQPPQADPLGRAYTPTPFHADHKIRRYGDPPIFLSLDPLGDLSTMKLLLELGADQDARDYLGWTPLIVAVRNSRVIGKIHGVPTILPLAPARLMPGHEGFEHLGAEAIALLLAHKASVTAADLRGQTPLHHAAQSDYAVEIARRLIDAGADIDARDTAGKSPLDHARDLNLVLMPDALIAAGAK